MTKLPIGLPGDAPFTCPKRFFMASAALARCRHKRRSSTTGRLPRKCIPGTIRDASGCCRCCVWGMVVVERMREMYGFEGEGHRQSHMDATSCYIQLGRVDIYTEYRKHLGSRQWTLYNILSTRLETHRQNDKSKLSEQGNHVYKNKLYFDTNRIG
ncbi:hypothetical protein BGW80DRAFT_609184 [Lactifluus volemus]|nr:hypothetical protein BGW80DRAFT_609184 [Lactifluus volemus]